MDDKEDIKKISGNKLKPFLIKLVLVSIAVVVVISFAPVPDVVSDTATVGSFV